MRLSCPFQLVDESMRYLKTTKARMPEPLKRPPLRRPLGLFHGESRIGR